MGGTNEMLPTQRPRFLFSSSQLNTDAQNINSCQECHFLTLTNTPEYNDIGRACNPAHPCGSFGQPSTGGAGLSPTNKLLAPRSLHAMTSKTLSQ